MEVNNYIRKMDIAYHQCPFRHLKYELFLRYKVLVGRPLTDAEIVECNHFNNEPLLIKVLIMIDCAIVLGNSYANIILADDIS